MSDFFARIWYMLVGIYEIIYQAGIVGVTVAFVAGLFFGKYGTSLTGAPATIHISGNTGTVQPAIEGKAKSFPMRMVGTFAKLIGAVLVVESLLAGTTLFMHMK